MLGGDLGDLLISVFKMASDSGFIVWKVDPDLAGVDIRECSVNIRKCTPVSGEGHVEEEQSTVSGEEHSEEEQSIKNEDIDWADDIVESKKSKLPKAAPKSKASKKRTKGVHSVMRLQLQLLDDSETEYEDQNKEPVGGRRRKFGEQIQESVTQHILLHVFLQ